MIALNVRDLKKNFKKHTVLSGINLDHRQGVLGVAGANGSGKSTFVKCISYLLRPTSGHVEWSRDGKILSQNDARSAIGITAPYINLYDELSGFENLEFLSQLSGVETDHEHIDSLLGLIGMEAFRDAPFKDLSTGQQQRFKLAASLVCAPDVLLLDEPGSNLDREGHQLVESIVHQQIAKGVLIILASNDPEELKLADRVLSVSKD